jgi:NAD(P)-dependent dehydrogenase (short-subunit alcohol dehydrogenase family)
MTAPVAIITGASHGIGAGLVAGYRRAGYAVVGVALSLPSSSEGDGEYVAIAGDIADVETAGRAVDEAVDRFGRIDTLINNAGIYRYHKVHVRTRCDLLAQQPAQRPRWSSSAMSSIHYFQPHAFLPRGRRLLGGSAPDVHAALLEAGADPQDLALKLHGPREPGDEDLVYLWVRRPVVE